MARRDVKLEHLGRTWLFSGCNKKELGLIGRASDEVEVDAGRLLCEEGKPGFAPKSIDEIPEILARDARPGDVVILMSSGAFGGLPATLLNAL